MSRPPLQRPTTYDIDQEQIRHDDAIHWFGEMTCFLSWWRVEDFENGLVGRCTECFTSYGDIAAAYVQPARTHCPTCFGTTFEGGLRAVYYRPAIWDITPVEHGVVKRGEVEVIRGQIEMMSNLDVYDGDMAVRADGSRWLMDQPSWQEITTGFGSQRGQSTRRLRGRGRITLDDPASPRYLPAVDLDALGMEGLRAYVPHSPHPLDQNAPDPVLHPTVGVTPTGLRVERNRLFEITVRFYDDPARQVGDLIDVSGITYVSEFRASASPASTLIATLAVDMTNAVNGEVTFSLSDSLTNLIVQNEVYWSIYRVEGTENVSVMPARRVPVV